MTHRSLIFLLITNVTANTLATGEYHVYRGRLSMTGQDLLNLFNYAVSELEKDGFCSSEDAEKNRQWIREEIQSIG